MPQILCKHCGMPNAPERMVCSFCHQPLHVVDDEGDSIRPGDVPTKKSTGELEPILPQWLRDARANARRAEEENVLSDAQPDSFKPPQKEEGPPDLLAGLEYLSHQEQDDELPGWMSSAPPAPPAPTKPEPEGQVFNRRQELHWEDEPADELGGLATTPIPAAPESGESMLPWMNEIDKQPPVEKEEIPSWMDEKSEAPQDLPAVSPFSSGTIAPPGTGELTDWMAALGSEAPAPDSAASGTDDSLGQWLSTLPPVDSSASPEPAGDTAAESDLPDWMKSSAEPDMPPPQAAPEAPLPGWMNSFRETIQTPEPEPEPNPPAADMPVAPAFSSDALAGEQSGDLFSAETPDWLSNIVSDEGKPESGESAAETLNEPIAPADLPSWVQAMRPVESVLPDADSAIPLPEGPVEEKGPLAGLQGVLPLTGGFIQPGKPKAQAIRLQVGEAQQADASLLEKMLISETEAKPLGGSGMLASQRVLRWVLSALLILLASVFLVTGMQSVPLPVALPAETNLMLPVLDALPQNAPVLIIFDYEPALAGELEASAAPLIDHLIGLRRPRLTLLSTSPTGSALAERFLHNTQSQHAYQLNQDYIDLGYLPGGMLGILSFAENPRLSVPSAGWNKPPAQDMQHLSDYAAILLLTDQAETARAWVEQTGNRRAGVPLLVVSSAQAAPMIQPYLLSGQVNGLLSGIQGGAAFTGSLGHSSLGGAWDAYNYTTLLAALLMVFGGFWNLIAGARARRRAMDEV
jgi:hypothetical protein